MSDLAEDVAGVGVACAELAEPPAFGGEHSAANTGLRVADIRLPLRIAKL